MVLTKDSIVNGFSGGAGGFVSRSITSPLNVIKTTNQVSTHGKNIPLWGIPRAMGHIVAESGIPGLWRGNLVACARLMPYNSVKFGVYHALTDSWDLHERFDEDKREWNKVALYRALAGGIAGFSAVVATFPLDILKVRQTVSQRADLPFHTARKAYKATQKEGWRGFYRGLSPTLAGAVFYSSFQFSAYETLKHFWASRGKDIENTKFAGVAPVAELEHLGFRHHMLLGGAAGGIGRFLAYPFDVIRKRLMIQSPCNQLVDHYGGTRYHSSYDCARRIMRTEGLFSFWKGRSANFLLALTSSAITFAVFEETKRFLYQMDIRPNPTLGL
mmetsp:Transcript_11739/g.21472  ORF Transcript_11739/g.21472 Transcript_11739/m.21472 type:complete len:330 (-) Transcript_11739:128-1117(-)